MITIKKKKVISLIILVIFIVIAASTSFILRKYKYIEGFYNKPVNQTVYDETKNYNNLLEVFENTSISINNVKYSFTAEKIEQYYSLSLFDGSNSIIFYIPTSVIDKSYTISTYDDYMYSACMILTPMFYNLYLKDAERSGSYIEKQAKDQPVDIQNHVEEDEILLIASSNFHEKLKMYCQISENELNISTEFSI